MANQVKVTIVGDNQTAAAFRQVTASLGGLAKTVGVAFGAREVIGFLKSVMDAREEVGKMAQKVGVSAATLSGFGYAAKMADVDMDGLAKGFKFLNQNIAAAQSGSAAAQDLFKSLGITVTDTNGQLKPTEEILLQVADVFSRAEDGAAKTALAVKLFGRAGMDLIPFLNMGRAGISDLTAEAQRLGVVIDDEAARQAEAFNDNLKRLESQAEGLAGAFLEGLVPAINSVAEAMNDPRLANGGLKNAVKDLVGRSAKWLAQDEANTGYWIMEKYWKFQGSAYPSQRDWANAELLDLQRSKKEFLDRLYGRSSPGPASTARGAKGGTNLRLPGDEEHKDKLDRLLKAETKLREAAAQRQADIATSAVQIQLSALELERSLGLVTIDDYFKRRQALTLAAIDAEINALGEKYRAEVDLISKLPEGQARDAAAVEAEKTLGDLQKKEAERQQAVNRGIAEEQEARAQLRDYELAIEAEVQAAKGQTAAVAIDAIRREFEEKRKYLQYLGKDTTELDNLETQRIAGANAEALAQKIQGSFDALGNSTSRVQMQMDQYALTTTEGQTQINLLNEQAHQQLSSMVDQYAALARASGDPRLIENANRMKLSLDQLGVKISWIRDQAAQGLQSSFEDFFTSIMTDAPNAAAAFGNFAKSIMSSIAGIISKMLAMWMVQKLIGWLMPIGGGGGGAAASLGSSVTGSITPNLGFAAAGAHASAGQPFIIGEKGPELFIPDSAGTILPNNKLNSLGGNSIRVSNYYDARGADPAAIQRLERLMHEGDQQSVRMAVNVVNEQRARM